MTKCGKREKARTGTHQIRTFKIAVQDSTLVDVGSACQELLNVRFAMLRRNSNGGGMQQALQVVFAVLEDHENASVLVIAVVCWYN